MGNSFSWFHPTTFFSYTPQTTDLASRVMKNELILAKIGKNLSVACLLDLRRTCHVWNSSFIPSIQKSHKPVRLITSGNSYRERRERGLTLTAFHNLLRSSFAIPFTNYAFHPVVDQAQADQDRDLESFLDFVSECGSNIKTLTLAMRERDPAATGLPAVPAHGVTGLPGGLTLVQLRQLIFEWMPELVQLKLQFEVRGTSASDQLEMKSQSPLSPLPALPNLKRVEVAVLLSSTSSFRPLNSAFTQLMADIIQAADGLELLTIQDRGDRSTANGTDFLGPILAGLVSNVVDLHNLKTLRLRSSSPKVPDIQSLLQLVNRSQDKRAAGAGALNLHSLLFGIYQPAYHDHGLETRLPLISSFLVSQSCSLTELQLFFVFRSEDERRSYTWLRFPRLGNLKRLTFFGLMPDEVHYEEGAMFMDTYPKLDFVSDNFVAPSIPMLFEILSGYGNQFFHSGVTSLETCSRDYQALTRTHAMFPSLTRLKLRLHWGRDLAHPGPGIEPHIYSIGEISSLWTMWPCLTSLHLQFLGRSDASIDEFLTGVPAAWLERLKQEFNPLSLVIKARPPEAKTAIALDLLRDMADKYKTRPGISDLKQLQDFSINFDSCNLELTDVGGYFGLALASPVLQRLVIQAHRKNLVSEPCRAFIKSTFGYPIAIIDL